MNATTGPDLSRYRLAVALPCYNEAPALPEVLAQWHETLPDAEIYVFDNNSTDDSAEIARKFGARVVTVGRQGKGYVVRAIFAELADRDVVIMTDADGTYPAS
ncbi:MAG: glycosyltransferase family 2 protein, partial [bacterium]